MPELPDLQVFARNLNKTFKGKTLASINPVNTKKLNVPAKQLKETLEGQVLTQVERIGKELHFEFKNSHILGLHLMLHGELRLFSKTNDHKFAVVELLFDDDTGLALTDFQQAATPTLDPKPNDTPDALSDKADFEFFKGILSKKRSPIKTILLDQHIIRGIGNAYADEILWHAKLSPFSVANKIPDDMIKELVKSISHVLEDAEKQIIKINPDIISGEERSFMKVHSYQKKTTDTGAVIHQKPISSRKTYYTDEQELFE